jgi:hypothetical protein
MGVSQSSICNGLPRGKGLATHRRVDRIEGAQAMDTCNTANDDRIAQIANLAPYVVKRFPLTGRAAHALERYAQFPGSSGGVWCCC